MPSSNHRAAPGDELAARRRRNEDARLLSAAGTGDQNAFAELYDRMAPTVYGTILRVVCDPAISEEVTQEVFVEVWRKAAGFDTERGTARSWIATIAHRRAVDRVRSEQARRDREDRDHEQAVDEPATDLVGDTVATRTEGRRVRDALADLPPAQRDAITLAYYSGRTHREVAEELGIPEGTAKTRIRDGMKRLRSTLEGDTNV